METIYRLNKHGVQINEIPIHFKNRRHGYSKIPGIEIFRTLKNLFKVFWLINNNILILKLSKL